MSVRPYVRPSVRPSFRMPVFLANAVVVVYVFDFVVVVEGAVVPVVDGDVSHIVGVAGDIVAIFDGDVAVVVEAFVVVIVN